ncbi:Tyrosine recombinase XerC [subsurface metagenome]
MSKSQISNFIDFIPAELHEGKIWYINYYVKHPATGELVRKQVKCNRIKSITERRKYGKMVAQEINARLRIGWNPFLEQEAPKGFHKLKETLYTFINYCKLAVRNNELRPDTTRSYISYINILIDWLCDCGQEDMFIINFNKDLAKKYLNYSYINKGIKPSTYNNYLVNYRRIFNWLKENDYTKVNPFEDIPKKKTGYKIRVQYIDQKIRTSITVHLEKNNYRFMVCCLLAYHCLIRPKEITYIKVGDIDLQDQQIIIHATVSKNKQERYATIPNAMLKYLQCLNLEKENPNHYLFSKGLKPGLERLNPRRIAKYWDKLRCDIGLPKEYQFYSLRDSGIIQKIKDNIPIDEVMYQADHHSLETTNIYVRIANPKIFTNIRDKATKF